jgi:hypothetical protein
MQSRLGILHRDMFHGFANRIWVYSVLTDFGHKMAETGPTIWLFQAKNVTSDHRCQSSRKSIQIRSLIFHISNNLQAPTDNPNKKLQHWSCCLKQSLQTCVHNQKFTVNLTNEMNRSRASLDICLRILKTEVAIIWTLKFFGTKLVLQQSVTQISCYNKTNVIYK